MKIYKYPLAVEAIQQILMQKGAEILCVQTQKNEPQLWALANETAAPELRQFITCATGRHPPADIDRGAYVGTYQLNDGDFVFHVFESTERNKRG